MRIRNRFGPMPASARQEFTRHHQTIEGTIAMKKCSRLDGNRTIHGHRLCLQCEQSMVATIRDIGNNYTALLLVATKQASVHMDNGPRAQAAEAPSPIRSGAWELCCEAEQQMRLVALAIGWRQGLEEKTTVPLICRKTLERIERLFLVADAAQWFDDLSDISERIQTMLEPPEPLVAFGACPACGGVVWGAANADYGDCAQCASRIHRCAVADRLLAKLSVSAVRGTASELSRACAKAGIRLPASTIRSWIRRGRLQPESDGSLQLSAPVPLLQQRAKTGMK